jgi:hypothetical protein
MDLSEIRTRLEGLLATKRTAGGWERAACRPRSASQTACIHSCERLIVQASPREAHRFRDKPGAKSLGYAQAPLWDQTVLP